MKHKKRENRRNTVPYEHASREEKRGRIKERRERSPQLHSSTKACCQPASLSACTPRSLPTCLPPFLPPCLPPWRGSMWHAVKLEWQLSSCQAAGGASAGHTRARSRLQDNYRQPPLSVSQCTQRDAHRILCLYYNPPWEMS